MHAKTFYFSNYFSNGLDPLDETAIAIDESTIDFSRLIQIVDEAALIRLGLVHIERVAQAEGRMLWH